MTTETTLSAGNLPAERNSFVGRERDLAELARLLSDVRALTLCGPGGIGRTRLALRLACEIVPGFPDGAWLVELADTEDPSLVTRRVATALGVLEEPHRPLAETLTEALRPRLLLLILDTCEHIVHASAGLAPQRLAAGDRTAPPRQQTLRAAVDWSYELLTEPEQVLLRRLAVFSGWNLEMAERVCVGDAVHPDRVLDLLAALIDKSLVTLDGEVDGDARYRLLDTIKKYAADRLTTSGEGPVMRLRHRDYMLQLVEGLIARAFLRGDPPWPVRVAMNRRVAIDRPNYRTALTACLERGDAEEGLRFCSALRIPWVAYGDVTEGIGWVDRFLELDAEVTPGVPSRALMLRADLAFEQQDYAAAGEFAQAGPDLCPPAGGQGAGRGRRAPAGGSPPAGRRPEALGCLG